MNNLNEDQLNKLIKVFNEEKTKQSAETLEIFLDCYLANNPLDTEIWVKLALTVYRSPLHDDLKAIDCLEKALVSDPYNIKVMLLLIYVIYHCIYFDDELFKRLCNLKTQDNELMSLIEYTKSWYYLFKENDEFYQKTLNNSIELCDRYVWNYIDLGRFYIEKGNLAKGFDLMKKGLDNLEYVYDDTRSYDVLNIEEFINERFRGIHLSKSNYEIILESFDPKSPWITGDFISKRDKTSIES